MRIFLRGFLLVLAISNMDCEETRFKRIDYQKYLTKLYPESSTVSFSTPYPAPQRLSEPRDTNKDLKTYISAMDNRCFNSMLSFESSMLQRLRKFEDNYSESKQEQQNTKTTLAAALTQVRNDLYNQNSILDKINTFNQRDLINNTKHQDLILRNITKILASLVEKQEHDFKRIEHYILLSTRQQVYMKEKVQDDLKKLENVMQSDSPYSHAESKPIFLASHQKASVWSNLATPEIAYVFTFWLKSSIFIVPVYFLLFLVKQQITAHIYKM